MIVDEKAKMKFKAHQSFFIRKGWLGKGLRGVLADRTLLMPSNSRVAMDELGLGSNQVVALRYWLETAGLIRKQNKFHSIEKLGALILDKDPYFEELGTLWALHCNIASAENNATSWYFFFNEFKMNSFDKDDFTYAIERYVFTRSDKPKVARASLESDFSCILNTYIPHERTDNRQASPENVIDCPLGELGLVDVDNVGERKYRKKPASISSLPALLVLYAICPTIRDFEDDNLGTEQEIRLETLLEGPRMPGRIYGLDSVGLLTKLYELENDGLLRINRTAGLDVVRITDPAMTKEDCLANYYEMLD